jgi:hypothetical protein
MTRPSEVKVREDSMPGTKWAEFEIGTVLPKVEFTITPEIAEEYMTAVEADPALYVVDGRKAAPPNVLAVYMTAALYQKYPPIQGIIMAEVEFDWMHPIWRDEATRVHLSGRILEKFEKRGRRYVRWEGRFERADGTPLAGIRNTFCVPE